MSTFIAEIKQRSPWDGESLHREKDLRHVAITRGDWVAAHTEAPWGGSLDHLKSVKSDMRYYGVDKPLLAKGVHADDEALIKALGVADYALVVGRVPEIDDDLLERVIFEPTRMGQALNFHHEYGDGIKMMWNARNLGNGKPRGGADAGRVKSAFGDAAWICQASFIKSPLDVHPNVDAHIVGTNLIEYVDGGPREPLVSRFALR